MSQQTSNAIAKINPSELATGLAKLAKEFGPSSLATLDNINRAFALAQGVQSINDLVLKAMPLIKPLIGTSLGFRTDRDDKSKPMYSDAVLAECITEALLRGLQLVGNQFNIIAGRCYITKDGMTSILHDFPGFSDLVLSPGVPIIKGSDAIVEFMATWKLNDKSMRLDRKIPIRINTHQGVDAILGKAERKMKAAIYGTIAGSEISEGEVEQNVVPPSLPPNDGIEAFHELADALDAAESLDALANYLKSLRGKELYNLLNDEQKNEFLAHKDRRKKALSKPIDAPSETDADGDPSPEIEPEIEPEPAAPQSPKAGADIVRKIEQLAIQVHGSWEKARTELASKIGFAGTRAKDLTAEQALKMHELLKGVAA